ncbi:putative Monad-binding region of RPAP3 family protein [Cryptosporidium felis]|nr:putative Monad-binding region of RPAP3 family protein [Cryptosporidium felis]
MEEYHRIPIVIVDDVEEIERRMAVSDNELEELDGSSINPKDLVKKLKEFGNRNFREGRFDDAIEHYSRAIGILSLEWGLGEEGSDFWVGLEGVILRSNRIACYVEKGDFNSGISESRALLEELNREKETHLRRDNELPTLWTNLENKARYRLSLSLFSSLEKEQSQENKYKILREAFDAVEKVVEYYQHELDIPAPREISALHSKLKKAVEAKDRNKNKPPEESTPECPTPQSESTFDKDHYLKEYLMQFGSLLEPSKPIESPVPIVERLSCRNRIEFIKIWQNISGHDEFLDFYLLFGQVFTNLDVLYSKSELESDILERILGRFSAMFDKLGQINSSKLDEKFAEHVLGLIKKCSTTKRFDFVARMTSSNFQILDKISRLGEKINGDLKQEIYELKQFLELKDISI